MPDIAKLSLAHQTMIAELVARATDASFDEQLPPNGNFLKVTVKIRDYWYYAGYQQRTLSPPDANTLAAAIDTSCAISGLATQDFGIACAATTDTKSAALL